MGWHFCFGLLLSLFAVHAAIAQTPQELFQARCGECHTPGNAVGAPLPETLRKMSWRAILEALETGKKRGFGEGISPVAREAIAKYLGTSDAPAIAAPSRCPVSPPLGARAAAADQPIWNGWADAANTRFQSARLAGLNGQSTPNLKLKWAFGFPAATTAFGIPTVFAGRLFVGAADGTVYSIDSLTGCVHWTYTAVAGVRTAPVIDDGTAGAGDDRALGGAAGRRSAYFGDLRGNVYAVDAETGTLVWKVRADDHPMAVITGSPKLAAGRLYVPVSGRDESIASTNPAYECCTFRGSIVALDSATGKPVWRGYTVSDPPKVTGKNKAGATTWGPSGAAVWSSPTLDLQNRVVYAGTGVNYSNPPTETSDAIVAFDMDSGRLLWTRQFTAGDSYNFACVGTDKTNCPRDPIIDFDLGNSGILQPLGGGRRILVASDKSGTVYGLDPDREGAILWKQKIAAGGLQGGIMWGGASDDRGVGYFSISDFTAGKPEAGGGLAALRLATGDRLWTTPAPKPGCLGVAGCSAAQPAPVTTIPGVAFLGSWDGHIRAYETTSGKIIWDFDTVRDFQTVNGVKARGGSINAMPAVVAGGMLYITSGYSGSAMPGNVLLAFSVEGR